MKHFLQTLFFNLCSFFLFGMPCFLYAQVYTSGHEQKAPLTVLAEKIAQEKENHARFQEKNRKQRAAFVEIQNELGADEVIRRYSLVLKQIAKIQLDLKIAAQRQVDLLKRLDDMQQEGNASAQLASFLREHKLALQTIGLEQKDLLEQLEHRRETILRRLKSLPPPERYSTKQGFSMRLAGKGRARFYISENPVPQLQGKSYQQIQEILGSWNEREKHVYALPTIQQLLQCDSQETPLKSPAWTAIAWVFPDSVQEELHHRFEVQMFHVWDKFGAMGHVLQEETHSYGELVVVADSRIGAYVVAPVGAGLTHLHKRIQVELEAAL